MNRMLRNNKYKISKNSISVINECLKFLLWLANVFNKWKKNIFQKSKVIDVESRTFENKVLVIAV